MNTPSQSPLSCTQYRIGSLLMNGSTGDVHLGTLLTSSAAERHVTIKRAHRHLLADPAFRAMFLEEAQNAAIVRHPNVMSVDDIEEADGELLLIAGHVDGTSLARLLSSRPRFELPIAISIVADVCAALNAIHKTRAVDGTPMHLVHQDISPETIIVGKDGSARITNFGVARATPSCEDASSALSRGRFGYMAPECMAVSVFSVRSDIFALGVVLWELLAGRTLFRDLARFEVLDMIEGDAVPPPSAENPEVTKQLDEVVRRCLAANAEHRFASAHELLEALVRATPDVGHRHLDSRLPPYRAKGPLEGVDAKNDEERPLGPDLVLARALRPASSISAALRPSVLLRNATRRERDAMNARFAALTAGLIMTMFVLGFVARGLVSR